ncbi:hypothetical protein [Falsiroseomonas sp. HW251]|uniref:hypothetical protein n=1 Tax=Falsiroseomonas sp. HW251 TaxID=3390998 RepID=UPI003D3115E9
MAWLARFAIGFLALAAPVAGAAKEALLSSLADKVAEAEVPSSESCVVPTFLPGTAEQVNVLVVQATPRPPGAAGRICRDDSTACVLVARGELPRFVAWDKPPPDPPLVVQRPPATVGPMTGIPTPMTQEQLVARGLIPPPSSPPFDPRTFGRAIYAPFRTGGIVLSMDRAC